MTDATTPSDPNGSRAVEAALQVLKPIRDLAQNWDIDIASCLDEYLEELGEEGLLILRESGNMSQKAVLSINSTEEGGKGTLPLLNFAHAAMVLQNSSHVYSRKVEYLHSLVYQALDDFLAQHPSTAQQRRQQQRRSRSSPAEEFLEFDPQQDFLDLNDVLPISSSQQDQSLKPAQSRSRLSLMTRNLHGEHVTHTHCRTRSSIGRFSLTHTMVMTSSSTTSAGPMDKSGLQLAASLLETGNMLGASQRQSRLAQGFCYGNNEDSECAVQSCLQLPGAQLAGVRPSPTQANLAQDELLPGPPEGNNEFPFSSENDNNINQDATMSDFDNDGDGGAGFVMNENEEWDTPSNSTPVPSRQVTFAASIADTKPKVDFWKRLDPHLPDLIKSRPLRVGKTIRLPQGVGVPPSIAFTRAPKRFLPRSEPKTDRGEVVLSSFSAAAYRCLRKRPLDDYTLQEEEVIMAVPLHGLAFAGEFTYIAKANNKRRVAERRERRKLARRLAMVEVGEEYVDFYEGGDDDGLPDDGVWNDGLGNTGIASVGQVYQSDADYFENDKGERNIQKSFEELCRAHLRAFRKGAEKYASQTRLIQRVDQWQEKLAPFLVAEEERPEFDIHDYGRAIIVSMETQLQIVKSRGTSKTNVVDFHAVARQKLQYDVCRLFLAALSLANSGNLNPQQEDVHGNDLKLQLLNANLEQPMENYLAPGARTF